MISIRKGMFETNSSSIHALIIDRNELKAKRTLKINGSFDKYYDLYGDIDGPSFAYCLARERRETAEFFSFLKKIGVETVYLDGNPMRLVNELADDPTFLDRSDLKALVLGDIINYNIDNNDTEGVAKYHQYERDTENYCVIDADY